MRRWPRYLAPLSGLAACGFLAPGVAAQTQAAGCPPEPTRVDAAQAKEWVDAARDTLRAGRASDALVLLDKAHRLVPTTTAGEEFVDLAIRMGRLDDAERVALELRRCGNVSESRITAWLDEIEGLRQPSPPPRDPPPLPLPEQHPLPPPAEEPDEPLCPADPESGFALSAGWEAWLASQDDGKAGFGQALRTRTLYSMPCGEVFELRVGVTAPFALTQAGPLTAPGGSVEVGLHPFGPLRMSLGLNMGLLLTKESAPEPPERSPETGPYLEPAFIMAVRVADHVEVGSHVGMLFANTRSAAESKFRMGFATMGLWGGYTFAPRCITNKGDREPC